MGTREMVDPFPDPTIPNPTHFQFPLSPDNAGST